MKEMKDRYIAADGSQQDNASELLTDSNGDYILDFTRNFEDFDKDDIIFRKQRIINVLRNDPDIKYALGVQPKKPLITYKNPGKPTDEEIRQNEEIKDYNRRVDKSHIYPWVKLNGVQQEVCNHLCVDVFTERLSYDNKVFNRQYVIFRMFINEVEMETEYEDVTRADLVSYIIKDLFNKSNVAGMHMEMYSNEPSVVDSIFYCRELRFVINTPNIMPDHGTTNRYDRR